MADHSRKAFLQHNGCHLPAPTHESGIWVVFDEGFDGPRKCLGHFEGILDDVIDYAVTIKGFWGWGPGSIERYVPVKIIKIDATSNAIRISLEAEKAELEARLKVINAHLP